MVLGVYSVLGPHERDHWDVDARHRVVALIAAAVKVGVLHRLVASAHHAAGDPIDGGVAQAACQIGVVTIVTDAREVDPRDDV